MRISNVNAAVLTAVLTAGAFGLVTGATVTTSAAAPAASPAPAASRSCPLPTFGPGRTYRPVLDRSGFTANVTNPFFPLVVGRTMIYTGVKDGQKALNVVVVTGRTRMVDRAAPGCDCCCGPDRRPPAPGR